MYREKNFACKKKIGKIKPCSCFSVGLNIDEVQLGVACVESAKKCGLDVIFQPSNVHEIKLRFWPQSKQDCCKKDQSTFTVDY
jgi:hypothetical protein